MSIPDKFLRIARHKLGELKEYIDQLDEEREQRAEQEAERRRIGSDARADARRELDEAISPSGASAFPSPAPSRERPAIPVHPPQSQRTPDEIARGVLFLVSDEGSFITGSTLSINGGQHMY